VKVGNKVLGLAMGQRSILIAEVSVRGQKHAVNRCAEFVFPEGLSMSTPDKLGTELRNFMRSQHFSTKDVVIGLPAKRLVTRRKEVPPASESVASDTLRLQAEGEFSSELDNLIMDYAGKPSSTESTTVLLMATNKVLLDECEELGRVAGLKIHAITSTTAALGRATSRLPGGDGLVLNLGPFGAELVIQHGQYPAHLRHLNVTGGPESIPALAAEIRRTVASIPQNGTPMTLALWNTSAGASPQNVLEQRLSMPVTMPDVSNFVLTETTQAQGFATAIALGVAALEPGRLAVDFLHSRLAPPKAPGMSMQKKLGIAGGILAAGLIGYAYVDLNNQQSELDRWTKINNSHKAEVAVADAQVKHYKEALAWLRMEDGKGSQAPVREALFDAVLRDLTAIFPKVTNSIWATDLGCKGSNPYAWEVKGLAVSQTYPERLQTDMLGEDWKTKFRDVHMDIRRQQSNASAVNRGNQPILWEFTLEFTYTGPGYKPPAPPAVKAVAKDKDNP